MRFPIQPGDHRNLKEGVRWWLEQHSQVYCNRRPGHAYASTEEFILKEGLAMPATFDLMGTVPDMEVGKCFDNCWLISQANWRYVYCEGWAIMDHGLPTHHAWLYDTWLRRVEDPTWREMYVERRQAYSGEPWTGHGVYWGVPIHQMDHAGWAAMHGYPNVLAVNQDDYETVLVSGLKAFTSRPPLDHNPPVVL